MPVIPALLHSIFPNILFRQFLAIDGVEELRVDSPSIEDVLDASAAVLAVTQTDDVNVIHPEFGFDGFGHVEKRGSRHRRMKPQVIHLQTQESIRFRLNVCIDDDDNDD